MKYKLPFLIVIAATLIFIASRFSNDELEDSIKYSFSEITRGPVMTHILTTGTVTPLVQVEVGSQVSGTIQHLTADYNQKVSKGDMIARIEPSEFKAKLAQEQANLQSAMATRDKAMVVMRNSEKRMQRTRQLSNQNMASVSEMDDHLFEYEEAKAEYQVMKSNVDKARASVKLAEVKLRQTRIYTPIDGIILSRDVDVGQTVAASLQAPTLFTIAQDLTRMQIEANVDEADIGTLSPGQDVVFSVYAYPDREYQGKLAQIRNNPEVEKGIVKYNCIIEVTNEDYSLKPGMTAIIKIITAHHESTLKAPNNAFNFIPSMGAEELNAIRNELNLNLNEAVIWKLVNGEPQPTKVQTGLSNDRETEIISDNVKPGMKLITQAQNNTKPKQKSLGLNLF